MWRVAHPVELISFQATASSNCHVTYRKGQPTSVRQWSLAFVGCVPALDARVVFSPGDIRASALDVIAGIAIAVVIDIDQFAATIKRQEPRIMALDGIDRGLASIRHAASVTTTQCVIFGRVARVGATRGQRRVRRCVAARPYGHVWPLSCWNAVRIVPPQAHLSEQEKRLDSIDES